jgi:N-acetylneuraminic acid mutarotase
MEDYGDVECYDDATNHWTAGPPIEARGTAGAVVYRGTIWVVGGESQTQGRCLASVLRFDPAQRTWAEAISLPTARNYARAALLGDAFFVVGGSTTAGSSHASLGSTLVDSARAADAGEPVKKKE